MTRFSPRLTRGLTLILALSLMPLPLYAATGGKAGKVDRMLQKAISDSAKQAPPAVEPEPAPEPEPQPEPEPEPEKMAEVEPEPEPEPETVTAETPEEEPLVFGNMRFHPALTLKTGYDDNIQAADTNEEGDFFGIARPEVHAELINSRNEFSIDLMYETRQYLDEDDENVNKFMAALEGAVKGEVIQVPYAARFVSDREDRREDLRREIPNEPIKTQTFGGEIGISSQPGKALGYSLMGRVDQFKYDNGRTETGTRVVRADADHERWQTDGTVSYEFMPGHRLSLGALYEQRDYEGPNFQGGSFTGPERDSERYAGWLGWTVNHNGTLTGDARLGFETRSYDANSIDDISNLLADLSLNWNIGDSTSLTFGAHHGHYEDDEIVDPILETKTDIGIEQTYNGNILLGAGAGWQFRDFEGSSREDSTVFLDASAAYMFSEAVSVGADYIFETRDSDFATADYNRNIYMLRLKGEL